MEKIRDYIKKNQIIVIVVVVVILVLVIGVPLMINWMFKVPALCKLFAVDWDAKDALGYYGDVLGFLGTVIFSGLALWQNHVIQQVNDNHTQILEQMEFDKNSPRIVAKCCSSNGSMSNIKLEVKNISENIAEKISVYGFAIIDEVGSTLWRREDVISVDYLIGDKVCQISVGNPPIENDNHQIMFDIKYYDKFGMIHACKVVGIMAKEEKLTFKITELRS